MSNMELGEKVIQVRSTVKHEKEYPSFTQDDIVFLFVDSGEDEECITLSTPVDIPTSTLQEVEADKQSTTNKPDTDLSSDVQTLPDQSINDMESEHEPEQESEAESDSDSPVPTAPRRSARSTKGIHPVCYGQVQIKSTIISDLDKPTRYSQVLYVPCYQ